MKQIPFEIGKFYHLYNRGNNKENLFREKKNYYYFLDLVKKHILSICNIYAYCLLPNHFHFVFQIKDYDFIPTQFSSGQKKLHQPFSNLFNAYSKSFNKTYNRCGSFFQEHPHRKHVDTEEYLMELIIYTILNPVRHGIDDDYVGYPHSSYQAMVSKNSTLLCRDEVLQLYSGLDNFKYVLNQRRFRDSSRLEAIEEIDI